MVNNGSDGIETPVGTITPAHFDPGEIRHQIFLGPTFLYALYNPEDTMHPVSNAFMEFLQSGDLPYRQLIVIDHSLDEAATRLKKKVSLRNATELLTAVTESQYVQFRVTPRSVFDHAVDRFIEWDDLDASLTDFLIASSMIEMDVGYIATYDRHFDAFDVTTVPYLQK